MEQSPSTPVGLLKLGASTQVQVDVFSDGIIQAVKEGNISAIEVLVQLKAFEKAAGRILKEIQENFVREADNYPGKSFSFSSNKIEKTEVGVKYDYSECNDPIWNEAYKNELIHTDTRQMREKFLKTLQGPTDIRFDDELVTITPPKKTGTTSLKVTIQ